MGSSKMVKAIAVTAVSFAVLSVVGYFLTMSGGKPMGTDLSIVGQGRPALVLAYENFSPAGGEALNRLRKVSSDFDSRLDFIVADLGTPAGREFASRHRLANGLAVLLTGDGQSQRVTSIPADENELRGVLESGLTALQ